MATLLCASCNVPMREVAQRLVCERCQSMQLAEADFAASVHELDGEQSPVEVADLRPDGGPCPRCAQPMQSCIARVGKLDLDSRVQRCEQHGLWLTETTLVNAYARASRMTSAAGRSIGQGYGATRPGPGPIPTAMGGTPLANQGGFAAALGSIGRAFNGRRHLVRATPHQHTAFVSSLRGPLSCPSCKTSELQFHGDRWVCPSCPGSFVEDAALVAMVMDIKHDYWEMPKASDTAGDRSCPSCKAAMAQEQVGPITLDRCAKHGIWFDESELQAMLVHEATAKPESSDGIRGWLAKLFG